MPKVRRKLASRIAWRLYFVFCFAILSWLSVNTAHARVLALGRLGNALPVGTLYPTPVGILYPGFNIAAGVNAAALANGKKVTAAQASVSPALAEGDSYSYLASVANSTQRLGFGMGYVGSIATEPTHGMFAGAGFNLGALSFGVGLRDYDLTGGFDPSVDIGTLLHIGSEFSLGAVAYNADTDPQIAFGVGFGRPKKDNVEVNVLLPALSTNFTDGSEYIVTFAATVYSGAFGTGFRSSYYSSSSSFTHTLAGLLWLTADSNLILQLSTPRTLTVGYTYVF